MKFFFLLCVILLISAGGFVSAKVVATFPEIGRPEAIVLDDRQIYITQRENIYIYSRRDYKLKTKIGKRGEGPKEFMMRPFFQLALGVKTDKITVYSMGKISQFSKEGVFIEEKKLKSTRAYNIQSYENFFLGGVQTRADGRMYNSAVLYDADLNRVKELKRVQSQLRGQGKGTHFLENELLYYADGDKLFVTDSNPFVIDVFDKKGNPLYSIKKKVKKVTVSDEFKKKLDVFLRTDRRYKDLYGFLQPITCADYFPAIQIIFADHKKLYVTTWQKKGNNYKCFVFETGSETNSGKLIKEIDLPLIFTASMIEAYPFTFRDNTFYQLVENEETENWELHATPVILE